MGAPISWVHLDVVSFCTNQRVLFIGDVMRFVDRSDHIPATGTFTAVYVHDRERQTKPRSMLSSQRRFEMPSPFEECKSDSAVRSVHSPIINRKILFSQTQDTWEQATDTSPPQPESEELQPPRAGRENRGLVSPISARQTPARGVTGVNDKQTTNQSEPDKPKTHARQCAWPRMTPHSQHTHSAASAH